MKKLLQTLLFYFLLALGVSSAPAQVTLTINGQPVTSGSVAVTTGSSPPTCTLPQVLQGGVCVTPPPVCVPPQVLQGGQCVTPTPPPGNCIQLDAPAQLGGIPPITPTSFGANQILSYRIAWDSLDNKSVGAYQPSTGLTVAISSQPCDIGTGAITNSGCYNTLPPNNPTQILIRVGNVNGYLACKRPPPNNGYLYVNFAWTGYTNFGQPLTNFCTAKGLAACQLQFRRDS